MKKLTILFALLFAAYITIAQDTLFDESSYAVIQSQELNSITGNITVNVDIVFRETVEFTDEPVFSVPDGWGVAQGANLTGQIFNQNDQLSYSFTISHPISDLPYYPQKIEVLFNTSLDEPLAASARIYFTPYNTIEVWNLEDFYNLPRHWKNPMENPNPAKMYVSPSTIPLSNIDTSQEIEWSLYDSNNPIAPDDFREIEIPGLAYTVLMQPIPADSLDYYDQLDDGPDSLNAAKSTFTGTVSGTLFSRIENDLRIMVNIPLSGISVNLYDKDLIGKDFLGSATVGTDGSFSITYSSQQGLF